MIRTVGLLALLLLPALLIAAPGDVPLSSVLEAPLFVSGIGGASSGEDYLAVYFMDGLKWQRFDLQGNAIDPLPRPVPLPEVVSSRPVWDGQRYVMFLHDGSEVWQFRVSRSGEESLTSLGPRRTILTVASSGGETALVTDGLDGAGIVTILDSDGRVLRQSSVAGMGLPPASPGVFRTKGGWRSVRRIEDGFEVFDAESGETVIPRVSGLLSGPAGVASPAGGVLLNMSNSPRLMIDSDENFHSVSIWGTTSAHDQGWAVLYLESGKWPTLSTIDLDGTGEDYPIEFPPQLIQRTTLVSASASRHLFFVEQQFGFAVYSVDNGFVRARGVHGVGPASQGGAAIGHGPGLDLVVWKEPSFSGLSLRGTRVRNGVPLDGPGFLLGLVPEITIYNNPPPVVAFDGEAFLVAWVEELGTISIRRVGIDGYVFETIRLDAVPTVGTSGEPALDLASRHDGAALLTWTEHASNGPDLACSLITRGVPGPVTVPIFPNVWISTGAASFNGDHFLVVGSSRAKYCQTEAGCMPPPPREVWSRILTPDGTPSGPAVLVEAFPFATQQKPLPFEDGWIVPVNHVEHVQQGMRGEGSRLVRVTGSGIPYRENGVIGDELIETADGPMVWSDRFRGMIDGELRPIWFEPLPVEDPFGNHGALSDGTFLIVHEDTRLMIRPASPHPLRADLGILISRSREAGVRVETIVVQHQGGDVIPAIHIGIVGGARYLGGWNVDYPDVTDRSSIGTIEGPFAPGDSVNFVIRWAAETHRDLFIWALPEARDEDAEDNFVTLPAVERRRLVGRGVE